jgi:hypothetical protein
MDSHEEPPLTATEQIWFAELIGGIDADTADALAELLGVEWDARDDA